MGAGLCSLGSFNQGQLKGWEVPYFEKGQMENEVHTQNQATKAQRRIKNKEQIHFSAEESGQSSQQSVKPGVDLMGAAAQVG